MRIAFLSLKLMVAHQWQFWGFVEQLAASPESKTSRLRYVIWGPRFGFFDPQPVWNSSLLGSFCMSWAIVLRPFGVRVDSSVCTLVTPRLSGDLLLKWRRQTNKMSKQRTPNLLPQTKIGSVVTSLPVWRSTQEATRNFVAESASHGSRPPT